MKTLKEFFNWINLEEAKWSSDYINANEVSRFFNVVHLSETQLGAEDFTFTPRVPRTPIEDKWGNGWEDDFTPRISLAPSIKMARSAGATGNFVYAGDADGLVDISDRVDNCPGGELAVNAKKNHFSLGDYLYSIKDELTANEIQDILNASKPKTNNLAFIRDVRLAVLPQRIRDRFYLCVPDSKGTQEKVTLEPITLMYIGKLYGEEVLLAPHAKAYLQSITH
jgi:hypothetical protein